MNEFFDETLMENYDPSQTDDQFVVGDPADDMSAWHEQSHTDSCAEVSQEFVLDELTGHDYTENELINDSEQHGWYTPGQGTSMNDVGNLIEEHGFDVEKSTGNSLNDLAEKLDQGDKVIVGVNGEEIWNNVSGSASQNESTSSSALSGVGQGQADHAVEVIGIDYSDKDNPMVILNDPGYPEGKGLEVPADDFVNAWNASDNFMVNTDGLPSDGNYSSSAGDDFEPSLGGYYNADGTYHWSSDDTNTDSHGNIVYYGD